MAETLASLLTISLVLYIAVSMANGTQIVFFSVVAAASYGLSFGLQHRQKSVLSLGLTMRNLGAALAPLFSLADVDQRSIIMVVLAVPMQMIFSLLAARCFARRASMGEVS